jgi:ABC-type sugar transport system substrate-binding protein
MVYTILLEHPDVSVILAPYGSIGLAANEKLMQMKSVTSRMAKFALFTCDWDPVDADFIAQAKAGKGVFRGSCASDNNAKLAFDVMMGKHNDELNAKKQFTFPLQTVTEDNVEQYLTKK